MQDGPLKIVLRGSEKKKKVREEEEEGPTV